MKTQINFKTFFIIKDLDKILSETIKGSVFIKQYKDGDLLTDAQRKTIAHAIVTKLSIRSNLTFDKYLFKHIKSEIGRRFPQEKEVS